MKKLLLILALLLPLTVSANYVARTIVNPAQGAPLSSAIMRNELQILENEIVSVGNITAGTTTVTCSGATSCPSFIVFGGTPIVISSSGGSGGSGTISTSSPLVSGQAVYATGVGTVASVATSSFSVGSALSLTGTAGALIGGTNLTLNCQTASGSQTGCLSSTDWTTFNNKGSGTVTTISVASANGFAGSSSGGATPALTISTSITGLLKGNGTAISAAAYTDFPTIAANTVLANGTSGTAAPTAIATSTLYGTGVGGQVLGWSNATGGLALIATSSSSGSSFAYPFPLNATSTNINFNSGVTLADSNLLGWGASTGILGYTGGTLRFETGGGIKMRIDSNVSVGFDAQAVSKLGVAGNVSIGSNYGPNFGAPTDGLLVQGNVGIGTTTPFKALSVAGNGVAFTDQYNTPAFTLNTASSTGAIFTVQATSTLDTLFSVDQYGHLTASSTRATPTVSSCGTGSPTLSANSNDVTGDVTTGTAATACTITFGSVYSSTPEIFIMGSSAASVTAVTSRSTTGFVIGLGTAATGDDISYLVVMP